MAQGTVLCVDIEPSFCYNKSGDAICRDKPARGAKAGTAYDVISVIDLQKLNTTYEYNTTGDLAKIIQDGQTKMTYTYDTHHNVKTATSQENLCYSFEAVLVRGC